MGTIESTFGIAVLAGVILPALYANAASPRLHILFDDGWRFLRGDAPEAWKPDFDDAGWREVDLPHDWAVEDLPPLTDETLPSLPIAEGVWRFSPGDDPAWKDPDFDDAAWQEVRLPASWEAHSNYTADNVYGWYRRRIEMPAELRGRDLVLLVGKVDDVDETFVNGVKVGGLGQFPPNYQTAWDQPRRYVVPAGLLRGDGTDLVAVRVFDGVGSGGLYAAVGPHQRSGPFDSEAEGGGAVGFTLGGVGWYRKVFSLPQELHDRRVMLTFDGVYMNCEVWLNGRRLGEHPYGYTSFHFDVTDHLVFGERPNVLAVRVDASGKTSRWYPGAGIYRHVWLTATHPIHVAPWGVYVTTPEVGHNKALVRVQTTLCNKLPAGRQVTVRSQVLNPDGKEVAATETPVDMAAGQTQELVQELLVRHPRLWSTETPTIYRLVTTVSAGGEVVDKLETPFGIRSISFDASHGFRLNGVPVKLRGGCVHHDNGCLGACAFDRAEERRVELLKAAGFNAVRTAHNPPSPAFLDACDRLGMLVIDEAFDCWRHGKNPHDYGRFFDAWWRRDIEAMVLRDRNHPCVILWSIGNEVIEQGTPEGADLAAMLASYVRQLDPTRPVTQAAHPGTDPWENMDANFAQVDVAGYNYKDDRYATDHERIPDRVIIGTESFPGHCFEQLMATLDMPWVAGDFVWTALDYLGESAIGHTYYDGETPQFQTWPWTTANCGDLDLCGFRRPPSYYREVCWHIRPMVACFVQTPPPPGKTTEHVYGWGWRDERPSWTWPGHEGETLTVRVYSSCPRVRLFLNGRDLGERETTRATRFTAVYEVPYEPGVLLAVGLGERNGELDRWELRTAGEPAQLRLAPDRPTIRADGQDLCFVTAEVLDAHGNLNPNANTLLRFALDGPGKIIGVGNGDPRSVESFQQPHRRAFRGRCLVVVRAANHAGQITLRAEAQGLTGATAKIRVVQVP